MKLLGSTKIVDQDVDQDKNSKNVPKLKIIYIILMHCNVVNTIAPQSLTMLKTTNTESNRLLEIETNVNINLISGTGQYK